MFKTAPLNYPRHAQPLSAHARRSNARSLAPTNSSQRLSASGGLRVACLALTTAFACVFAPATLATQAALSVLDDFGHRVSPIPPDASQRIVALAPHLCELAHTAEVGAQLVGVSSHCDYPPDVTRLTRVADYRSISFERLAQLQPNLILVWKANLNDRNHLSRLRLITPRVFVSDPHDFQAVANNLIAIGRLTGRGALAQRKANAFLAEIRALKNKRSNQYKVKTLYLIHSPPPITVNGRHWISRLLTACGAENIFADAPTQVVNINAEALLLNPPDLIVHSMSPTPVLSDRLFGENDAPVSYIHADLIQRPAIRLVDGARRLCAIVDARRPIVQRRDRGAR